MLHFLWYRWRLSTLEISDKNTQFFAVFWWFLEFPNSKFFWQQIISKQKIIKNIRTRGLVAPGRISRKALLRVLEDGSASLNNQTCFLFFFHCMTLSPKIVGKKSLSFRGENEVEQENPTTISRRDKQTIWSFFWASKSMRKKTWNFPTKFPINLLMCQHL